MKLALVIVLIAAAIFATLNVEAGNDGCAYTNQKTCVKNDCYWTSSVMIPGPKGKKVNACTTNSLCKPSCGCHAQPKCYITCPTACVATPGCAWKPGKGCHPPGIVSSAPTLRPTENPTNVPTAPTDAPTPNPTDHPTTESPTTANPTPKPSTSNPTDHPTTDSPTTANPTPKPTTQSPTKKPTGIPTIKPTSPTDTPTVHPTNNPTHAPTKPCDDYDTSKSCLNAGCYWTEKLLVKGDNGKNYDACKTDTLCKKSCGCHSEAKCYITCPTACEATTGCTWVPDEGCEVGATPAPTP